MELMGHCLSGIRNGAGMGFEPGANEDESAMEMSHSMQSLSEAAVSANMARVHVNS